MNLVPLILTAAMISNAPEADATAAVKAAVQKGLERIEQGASNYPTHRSCFSCHHQAVPVMALSSARQRGFAVTEEQIGKHVAFSLKGFTKHEQIAKGQGIGGANTTAAYALAMLASADYPADDTTQALVGFLLARQRGDGAWPAVTNRPPSEGSAFTNTALAILTLKKYGLGEAAPEDMRQRVEAALTKGKDWLAGAKPMTHEDKVFRVRGLVHAGADAKDVAADRDALLKEQGADGSWSQIPDLKGDAYATGSALVALRIAGLEATHAAYGKATKFLVSTQRPDGAWLVETRSRPIQTFFDNGDPGGKSQFISMSATSWAVLALLENLSQGCEPEPVKAVNLEKLNTEDDEDDPFVAADQLSLYYAAEVKGKWEIRKSQRSGTGKPFPAGKPVPDLNTKGGETRSPFLREGNLYFATNGLPEEVKIAKNFDLWMKKGNMAALPLISDVNAPEDDLHPWITSAGKEFYFSRKTKEGWTLFVAAGPSPGPIGKAKAAGFDAGFHHATLSKDGLTMYLQGPLEKDRWGLFRAKRAKAGAAWSKPEQIVNLNHPEAPRGDMSPCLSADGALLYFVSDRPGGKGGTDIWAVSLGQLKTGK